jgi:PKD repeat protein
VCGISADTLIIYSELNATGRAKETTDANYSTIRNDVGDAYDTSFAIDSINAPVLTAASTTDIFTEMRRGIVSFNTSELPDDCIISSAIFSIYGTTKAGAATLGKVNVSLTGGVLVNNSSIESGDYDGFSSIEYAAPILYDDYNASGWNNFTFNSNGISAISRTSYTVLFIRDSWDVANSFGGVWKSSVATGFGWNSSRVVNCPVLTIDYGYSPVAAFSGNVTNGYPPFSILFTDSSTNTPTGWDWYFGDETKDSDDQNPIWTVNLTIGNTITKYTIKLLASNAYGNDWENKTNYITAYPLNSSYTCNTTYGYPPFTVLFTSTTNNGTPTTWDWYFPNGGDSHTQNATWTFDYNIGNTITTYNIALNSSNTYSYDWQNDTGKITAYPLNASFTANVTSGCGPLDIQFTDLTNNGTPTGWNWSFGDGTYSDLQNPTHTFSSSGTFNIILNASNVYSYDIETKNAYIEVTGLAPVASFSANATSGYRPLTVAFTDASTGIPTAWNWSFGDGNYSNIQNPEFTYNITGLYNVTLNVSNTCGYNISTRVDYINVSTPSAPVAQFSANTTSGYKPLAVKFTDSSTGIPTAWNWSFGDGNYSELQNPTFTYNIEGLYTVILNASNAYGYDNETKTDYINVTEVPPIPDVPYAAFTANITSGNPPMLVQFNDTSHLANLTATAWYWNFGDGTTNTSQNITHWFNTSGIFTVVFTTKINGTNYTTSQNILLGGEGVPVEHGDSVVLQTIGFVPDFIFIIIFSIGITMLVNSLINYSMISAGMAFGSFTILSFLTPLLSKFYDFQIYDPTTPSNWLYIPVIVNTIPPYLTWLCYGLSILSFFLTFILIFYTSMNWMSSKREPPMGEDFLQ